MKSKKILVTGGAGYIGSHTIVELYENGYVPVVIDNFSKSDHTLLDGIKKIIGIAPIFYEGDCADKNFLDRIFQKENPIAGIIHFAAYKSVPESVSKPIEYYHNNINALLAVLDTMQKFEVKNVIFSSSCSVYGEPDSTPVYENTPLKEAESPYGVTKQLGEQILRDVVTAHSSFRAISLRYFNPIGAHPSAFIGELPLEEPDNLVPYIMQTAAGIHDKLTLYGEDYDTPDGTCIRDFMHVVDLAKAHVRAMQKIVGFSDDPYRTYNLGTGYGTSVLQLVRQFIETTNISIPYEMGCRRPGDVVRIYANSEKAYRELDWRTTYSVRQALQHAWDWEKKIRKIL